ncbi:MAG: Asp-tRNA(Asn)/Glu-tRNA(Gln) amidotransferase subunit GatC [Actinobacteria bacterium]|nr:Asp-tRNA(Asn)/Glu-tRNA(Gln) amidotransferase subunit GatC [Actinomycetota bacterium]
MSKLSRDELRSIADLARIALTEAELDQFSSQLDVILDSVAKVQEIVNDEIKPMSHALDINNVFRADVVGNSLSATDALAAAPASEDDRFRVPRILEEE